MEIKIKIPKIDVEWISVESRLDKLIRLMEEAMKQGGIEAVKEVCRNTKGKESAAAYFTLELIQKYK